MTSWLSGCTIGGGKWDKTVWEEKDFIEKLKSRLTLKPYGRDTHQKLRYTCVLVQLYLYYTVTLTHRHPTFGIAFLALLAGFHPSNIVRARVPVSFPPLRPNLENNKKKNTPPLALDVVCNVVEAIHPEYMRLYCHLSGEKLHFVLISGQISSLLFFSSFFSFFSPPLSRVCV